MRQKSEQEIQQEIKDLNIKNQETSEKLKDIISVKIPAKEIEIVESSKTVKQKKEEIRQVTAKQREELRELEKKHRSLVKDRSSLECEERKLKNYLRSLPTKIKYRENKLEEIEINFNPSRKIQRRNNKNGYKMG